MDRDKSKRKARSGDNDDCRRKKEPKLDSPQATTSTHLTGNVNSEAPRNTDFTQALVAMWFGGNPGHPFMTQEVRDGIALKDCQEKCLEAEKTVHTLKSQVTKAHNMINEMNKSLKAEEATNAQLMSELNLTGDLAATIKDMVNYITDTLQRCKQHKDHLSDLYNDIILTQKNNYRKLEIHEKDLQDKIADLQSTISGLEQNLQTSKSSQEDKTNQIRKAFEADLTKLRKDSSEVREQLEKICVEKTNIQNKLAVVESRNTELQKQIGNYQNAIKALEEKLANSLAEKKIIAEENCHLKNEINDKNNEIITIAANLESAITKQNEQLAEILTFQKDKKLLEEKVKNEIEERVSLAKSSEAANERIQELAMQVENLKQKREEALREMQEKIENAEKETRKIASEAKKETEELKTKHEVLVKTLMENYESSVAEIKLLKSHHQTELAKARESSNSALMSSTTENRLLDDTVNALKREKTTLQVEMQQIEDLLKKHLDSEKQLRAKLDAEVAAAQAEKKRRDDDAQKHISKIQELEKQLLNLQFNQTLTVTRETPVSVVSTKPDPKVKESVKKTTSVSTYKKSILKREPNRRKTRSTPPSPVSVAEPMPKKTDDRKIKFDFDSSPDKSPVKLTQSTAISKFMDDDFFDDLLGKSCSQPLQSSQTLKFQKQPTQRKFFKSRSSQSK